MPHSIAPHDRQVDSRNVVVRIGAAGDESAVRHERSEWHLHKAAAPISQTEQTCACASAAVPLSTAIAAEAAAIDANSRTCSHNLIAFVP